MAGGSSSRAAPPQNRGQTWGKTVVALALLAPSAWAWSSEGRGALKASRQRVSTTQQRRTTVTSAWGSSSAAAASGEEPIMTGKERKAKMMKQLDLLSSATDYAAYGVVEDGGQAVGLQRWPRFTPGPAGERQTIQIKDPASPQTGPKAMGLSVGGSPGAGIDIPVEIVTRGGGSSITPGSSLSTSTVDRSPEFESTAAGYGQKAFEGVTNLAENTVGLVGDSDGGIGVTGKAYQASVKKALKNIEEDMRMLDRVVGGKAQLSGSEFSFLVAAVAAAGTSPFILPAKVVEFIVPASAAFCAAVGLSAEFVGKIAVANGKEIAAVTLQAAAEAEAILAAGERAKAVIPLCVGLATSAAAFSLLAPALIENFGERYGLQLATEFYLIFPIIGTLAAAVAGLAYRETASLCRRAVGVGTRRFAQSTDVGRTWLSATQQVIEGSDRTKGKFSDFAISTLPAPVLACLIPGDLSFKAIVAAAAAVCQVAWYLTTAEYEISRAMDAVALKTRAAAVSDTYANQGTRSGAILPFTSALGGLCAAGAAAVVEALPLIPHMPYLTAPIESVVSVTFPALGAVLAGAASVAKARCEVDAQAAKASAEAFAEAGNNDKESRDEMLQDTMNSVVEPVQGVLDLIGLTTNAVAKATRTSVRRIVEKFPGGNRFISWFRNRRARKNGVAIA